MQRIYLSNFNTRLIRLFVLLSILHYSLFGFLSAYQYNETVLIIHSKLVPKIAMMDEKFEQKLSSNKIVITVLYENGDDVAAERLKEMIDDEYKGKLSTFKLEVVMINYDALSQSSKSAIYYLLKASKEHIAKAVSIAKKQSTLTFSYEESYLEYGVVAALSIEKKTSPYINVKAAKDSQITLKEILFRISKIYGQE